MKTMYTPRPAVLGALLVLLALAGGARAQVTTNPNIPATNAPLLSAPVRGNFGAVFNDLTNVLQMFQSSQCPTNPLIGQDCLNTGSVPAVWSKWTGTAWAPIGTLNLTTGQFLANGAASTQNIVNVTLPPFNAACDGVTDDTVKIQSAMNNASGLFIPSNVSCVVSNLVATRNVRFSGNGPTSVLLMKPSATGYMIDSTTSFQVQVDNMALVGQNVQDYNGVFGPGSQSGIHLWANIDNSMVTNSVVTGFNNIGIGINGDASAVHNGTIVAATQISENFCAIDTGPSGAGHNVCNAVSASFTAAITSTTLTASALSTSSYIEPGMKFFATSGLQTVVVQLTGPTGGAGTYTVTPGGATTSQPVVASLSGLDGGEYLKILGNSMVKNQWAVVVDSGNVNTVANDIAHNGTCLFINGSPTPNPDHGNFTNNLCNHSGISNSGQSAVFIHSGVGNGYIISNNQFFGGDWFLNTPDGIMINGNTIAVSNGATGSSAGITISGVGYINWANNWFTEISPILADTSFNTHWNNNFDQICQCFVNNQTALLVDPRGISATTANNTFGSNVVVDGTFTSNPGPWTLGTGWTINTGTNSAHGDGTGNTAFLKQNISATANQYYQVVFTIANYVSGTINVGVGGAAANWPFFANGTYTIPAVATQPNAIDGNLYFVSGFFHGDIQNVQVKLVTFTTTLSSAQVKTPGTIVANLSVCNAGNAGARAFVTDATQTLTAGIGANVSGSGSNAVPVFCDGANWKIG